MKIKMMMTAALLVVAMLSSCGSDNETPTPQPETNVGKFLIETTVKNPAGNDGASYMQLLKEFSGSADNSKATQLGFACPMCVYGNEVYVFPPYSKNGVHAVQKYVYNAQTGLTLSGRLNIPAQASVYSLVKVSDTKAYVPLYNVGTVWIVNPQTMQKTSEISLAKYAHADMSPDPAQGFVRGDKLYLPFDQISTQELPYPEYQQVDVAIIGIKTDKVDKVISETTTGLSFPTRPYATNMIFEDESHDLWIACSGYFGYVPGMDKSGFVCIPFGKDEFDTSRSWDISQTTIEGTSYKPVSIYNCRYIGQGRVAAFVCISELSGDNPYTARNCMAVEMDLNKRTIKRIANIPLAEGSISTFIGAYGKQIVFSIYGEKEIGFFTYNPETGKSVCSLNTTGNPVFFHYFE